MNRYDFALNRLPVNENIQVFKDRYGNIDYAETERILVLGDEKEARNNIEPEPIITLDLLHYLSKDANRLLLSPESPIKYVKFISDKYEDISYTQYTTNEKDIIKLCFFFETWARFQNKGLKTKASALYLHNIMNYYDIDGINLTPHQILEWASNFNKTLRIVASCSKQAFFSSNRGQFFDDRVIPSTYVIEKVTWNIKVLI